MPTVTVSTDELRALVAEAVQAATAPLTDQIQRMACVLNAKVASPVTLLTTREAAERARRCEKTVRGWIHLGYLTDRRGGGGKGAGHLVMLDELEVLLSDGPEAARRYRTRMGRD